MYANPILRSLGTLALAAALLSGGAPAQAQCDCTTLPTLGIALDYPAMSLYSNVDINGNVQSSLGNIGLGNDRGWNGEVLFGSADEAVGGIYHEFATTVDLKGATGITVVQQDMTAVVQAVKDASAAFAAMAPTQSFVNIRSSTTITGNGCINVIAVAGRIDFSSDETLTLKGDFDDYFIFNIGRNLDLTGQSGIVLDGVDPAHVIFNMIGASPDDVDMSGGSSLFGTILAPRMEVDVGGNAFNRGAYYAGDELRLRGSAVWEGEPFECQVRLVCPDPERSGINIQTPSTPTGRSTGNTPFFQAYYDQTDYEGHLEAFRVNPDGVLKDSLNLDVVDPVTRLLKSTRTPYWDAGILLRSDSSRDIYTTKSGVRVDFNTTNATVTDLDLDAGAVPSYPNYPASGVDDLTKLHNAIIDYVHGKDAFDDDADADRTEIRDAVLGDIFRSNALFIGSPMSTLSHEQGYGGPTGFLATNKQRDRVVYAGANDALLHAFDAGAYYDPRDPSLFNSGTGAELFAYMPGLLLPIVKQTPKYIDADGSRLIPGFVDGNNVAADVWMGSDSANKLASDWATVVIAAYREGGRGYLALDVTNPAEAGYPKLLFEFTNPKSGQSWSKAVITRIKLGTGAGGDKCGNPSDGDGNCSEQWVAIVGGGLELDGDPNERDYLDPTSLSWSDRSKAIFMIALDTGQLLASVEFDSSGSDGPDQMLYSIPSAAGVLDLNHDGFADMVYIGDSGGQVWKWDISAVGVDSSPTDGTIDNYTVGKFFESAPTALPNGRTHYRSMYAAPTASWVRGTLTLAFGTGERRDVLWAGDGAVDDENRFYVVRDKSPYTHEPTLTEADLTDVTSSATYIEPSPPDHGYFFKLPDGEKFFTDVLIFAGHVIAVSYEAPPAHPVCGPGKAHIYVFEIGNASGFFPFGSPSASDRTIQIGSGIPSSPRATVASDPTKDKIFITTSTGQIITIDPPQRDEAESASVYWKQNF